MYSRFVAVEKSPLPSGAGRFNLAPRNRKAFDSIVRPFSDR
jgi:hypothetical protein